MVINLFNKIANMKKVYNSIMLSVLLLSTVFMGTACSDDNDETGLNKYPAPTITEFYPNDGYPSSIVTIKGANFGKERAERIGRIYFGGIEAKEYTDWSDTEIKVRVPDNAMTGNITLWVWKNHTETASKFTCIPGAEIISITPNPTFPGTTITLMGKNFQSFIDKGLTPADIIVEFKADEGVVTSVCKELTETTLTVDVPSNAVGGNISVKFGELQKVTGPELAFAGDVKFSFMDYVETNGSIKVADGNIDSTKDGAYVIFKFTASVTGLFDVYTLAATMKDGSSLNVNIGDNLNVLRTQELNSLLTKEVVNRGNWTTDTKGIYGPFFLKAATEYYLKVTFLTTSGSWVANLHELGLVFSADQTQTPIND